MARVDYYNVREKIKNQLEADSNLTTAKILIEQEIVFGDGPTVIIYLERRDAVQEEQSLAAGTRTRFQLQFSIMCFDSSLKVESAIKKRDDLLGNVELALMKDTTFGDSQIGSSWLTGGTFATGKGPEDSGFFSGAEITLVVQMSAIL